MSIRTRLGAALAALLTCVWISATSVRHFAATPDGGLVWLLLAPVVGCGLAALGLAWEHQQAQGGRYAVGHGYGGPPGRGEVRPWGAVFPVALWLQFAGWGILTWRAVWMFFSWDGMFYFVPWLLLTAAVLLRWRPRSIRCA